MAGSSADGGKVFGRFTEPAHQVLDLARAEAEQAATAISARSISGSGCSPRATAGPPSSSGLLR